MIEEKERTRTETMEYRTEKGHEGSKQRERREGSNLGNPKSNVCSDDFISPCHCSISKSTQPVNKVDTLIVNAFFRYSHFFVWGEPICVVGKPLPTLF